MQKKNYTLVGNLFVPSRSIGFVEPGLRVLLKYEAFPYERFGMHEAEITSVSQTIYSPEALSQQFENPIALQEPAYRVEVALKQQDIVASGSEIKLQNGMTMTAEIEYDHRTLIEWVFAPLYSLKGNL